jgi:hypothetical protein
MCAPQCPTTLHWSPRLDPWPSAWDLWQTQPEQLSVDQDLYAASSVAVVSSGRSTSLPFSNFAPARTSATRWGRRTRTIAVSRIRNYSEHRVVPSRPALSRRSCLEPFIGHPGRYAPSQADPQISSIAPDRSCPTLTMRGSWRHFPGHQLRVTKSRHRRRPCGRHRTSGRDADPGRAGRDEQQSNLDGFHAGYFVGASIGAYCPKYVGHT